MSDVRETDNAKSDETGSRIPEAWRGYYEAELGFRNHWYPALYSHELGEEPVASVVLGESVIFRRVDGQPRAISDRCAHRRVKLSAKIECYTKDTITCWYHGFTYSFEDGALVQVLTEPGCALIGKMGVRSYAVKEAKGVVFIYIGDGDPSELEHDLAPGFLDADMAITGIRRTVPGNWRLATENGFDTTHIYIHRNSKVVTQTPAVLPLGFIPQARHSMEIVEGPGAKGVVDKLFDNYIPVFETMIGDTKVSATMKQDGQMVAPEVSCWLPGALKLENFPAPGFYIFEWYVPIDATTHTYFQVMGKRVKDDTEAEQFYKEAHTYWKDVMWYGFNNDDVFAREFLEEAYTDGEGWKKEKLYKPDMCLIEWRKLASKHNRGIQKQSALTD